MAKDLIASIATSGRAELLERTLASLEKCRKPDIFRGVIVVENGPKGRAEDVVRPFVPKMNARYLYVPEPGLSRARNKCLEAVREIDENCFIVFIDDDVRLDENMICAYAAAAAGTDAGVFYGGPACVDYEAEPPEWLKAYLPPSARGWNVEGGAQAYNAPHFLGFNWAAFAKDILAAGGFSSEHGPGGSTGSTGSESNMQERLLKAGVKGMYLPDAVVWHYVPAERCSPIWAIRRVYRQRMESGLKSKDQPTFLGISRRLSRHFLQILRSLARGNGEAVFAAFFRLSRSCGYMRGSLLARKREKNAAREALKTTNGSGGL